MNTNDLPADLISLRDAASLIPSPRDGKKTHINTIRRWVFAGRIPYWRNGPWIMVSRAQVLALLRPGKPAEVATAPDETEDKPDFDWRGILAKRGLRVGGPK